MGKYLYNDFAKKSDKAHVVLILPVAMPMLGYVC